ncbi:MAG: septum formation initiator family protein [Candidatus Levybacteria bacterium]|nr:septum formation initiator family protein [Candidatus Levybacteria bacterium]
MRKFVVTALFIASFLIINNLVRSIYNFWHKQDLLVSAQQELQQQKKEREKLTRELTRVKDPLFIEQEARDKLFLVKPGERIVLLPKEGLEDSTQSGKPKKREPNWKQWLVLFFRS